MGRKAKCRLFIILLAFALLWPYRHFSGDDAFITYQFSKNLSQGFGFSFNPGTPTYGSTSPLWVFVLAGVSSLAFSLISGAHILNFIFAILAIVIFFEMAETFFLRFWFAVLATLLFALDPWFIKWAMSGMENALILFLIVTAFYFHYYYRNTKQFNWITPVCCGVGILARPEMGIFFFLINCDIIFFETKFKVRQMLGGSILFLCLLLPWLGYAEVNFGTIIPNAILAKISAAHEQAFKKISLYFLSIWFFQALALLSLLLSCRKMIMCQLENPEFRSKWFLVISWAIALPLFYIAGGAPVSARYLIMGLPCYLLVGVKIWEWLFYQATSILPWIRKSFVLFCAVANIALLIGVQYEYCWLVTKWPDGMDPRMIDLAKWVKSSSSPNSIIAFDQVGVIGYYSDRQIVDTAGIISPEIVPYLNADAAKNLPNYLENRGIHYLITRESPDEIYTVSPVYHSLELVREVEVVREGGADAKQPIKYYVYETHFQEQ